MDSITKAAVEIAVDVDAFGFCFDGGWLLGNERLDNRPVDSVSVDNGLLGTGLLHVRAVGLQRVRR